jgi:putative glutathione S-transferase
MSPETTPGWRHETNVEGRFVRAPSLFRDRVTTDGSSDYRAERGRYHLYVSYACPWAHRTIIFRKLKKLEDIIDMTVVDPIRDDRGWRFVDDEPDPINGFRFLREGYLATDPDYASRVTVPVLWDKHTSRIVNNESSEIIRMLNAEFDEWGDAGTDFCPRELVEEIDELNAVVYTNVNNGVYKCGFASSQEAYAASFGSLFETLEMLDERLATNRYLMGDALTEADWRLFTTLVRFDAVYVGHFKCNKQRIVDYPNLSCYLRELYQMPHIAGTVNMDHIKRHYYETHLSLNPTGIVPAGPDLDFEDPHGRG